MPPDARHERRIVVSTGIVSVYECRAAVAAVAPPPSESVRNGRNPERFAPYPGANAPETDPGMRAVSLLGSDAASVCMRVRSEKRVLPTGMPEGFRRVFSEGCEQLPERSLRGLSRQCGKPGRKHRFTGVRQGAVVRTTGYSRTVRRQFLGLFRPTPLSGSPPSVRSSKARPSDPVRMKSQSVCEPQIGETGSNLLLHNSSACFSRSPFPTHPVPRRLPTCPAEPLSLRSSAGASARGAWPY